MTHDLEEEPIPSINESERIFTRVYLFCAIHGLRYPAGERCPSCERNESSQDAEQGMR
jgi:hypothetical protein